MNRRINNRESLKRFSAAGMAAIVAMSSVIWASETEKISAESDPLNTTETQEAIEAEYPQLLAAKNGSGANSKDETVYVSADAEGNVKAVTVTEWLRNSEAADKIRDVSSLTDIENTANDSSYTTEGNVMVWDAGGADIRYKGKTESELPVSVSVSYYLDGKQMTAEEIAGKEGRVSIIFNYSVRDTVSSGDYTFDTPYTMASGVILNDEHFTDIKIDGGKVVDDGSSCICLGLAFPGMRENLGIDTSSLNIPEKVIIEAYTDKFEIDGTYTVALTGIMDGMDLSATDDAADKVGELTDALDQMGQASDKLVSGTSDLSSGADQIANGADQLSSGAKQLSSATTELYKGLETISGNSGDLRNGAKQVFESLLSTAQTQLSANGLLDDKTKLTINNYKDVLNTVIASLDEDAVYERALEQVTAAVEANRSTVEEGVTAAVKEQVIAGVTAQVRRGVLAEVLKAIPSLSELTPEDYEAAVKAGQIDSETAAAVSNTVDAQMESEEVQQTITGNTETQMKTADIQQQIKTATDAKIQELINEQMHSEEVQKQIAAASEGAKQVIALKSSLDDFNAFYLGVLAYSQGVDTAASGSSQISAGAAELSSGAAELAAGADELSAGVEKLYDGMNAFNKDGIKKLISTLDDADIESTLDRIEAFVDAAGRVRLVGGIAEGMEGTSKIIFKTSGVKSD